MKFLCVSCDEAMHLAGTRGPDSGSMTVIFECPDCGRRFAMLTNPAETQVVRSLGVTIGGQRGRAEPMEGIRTSLTTAPSEQPAEAETVVESKCPFTGMVNEAFETIGMPWAEDARKRVERIPAFARPMAIRGVEEYAGAHGYTEISEAVLDQARDHLGL